MTLTISPYVIELVSFLSDLAFLVFISGLCVLFVREEFR